MSGDVVIRVEHLSKRYLIGHRSVERERYTALRDVIAWQARTLGRRAADAFRGRQLLDGQHVEPFWALKDVGFEVRRGEVLGIVGRNGAGKSTLLRLLSRITEPSEGRITLRGRVGSLLEVGTGFHPELSGRENIYLNGAILGMKRREIARKFDEIVAFAEVERFLDTPVKRYSSGMYVRLAFAVAAHLEPEILIVDEVLAVGDIEFQRKCLGKMEDVAGKDGRTILFVSHNMAAVESMCGSAMLLVDGRKVAHGETPIAIQAYLDDVSRTAAVGLHERLERQGSGEVRVQSFSMKDANGRRISAVSCGSAATLSFAVENRSGQTLRSFRFAIGVDNEMGQRVALFDSKMSEKAAWTLASGPSEVDVHVPRMLFVPGRYRMTIFATANDNIADWVKSAAAFDVEPSDYFGTGQLPPQGQAVFLLDHHFDCRTASERRVQVEET